MNRAGFKRFLDISRLLVFGQEGAGERVTGAGSINDFFCLSRFLIVDFSLRISKTAVFSVGDNQNSMEQLDFLLKILLQI